MVVHEANDKKVMFSSYFIIRCLTLHFNIFQGISSGCKKAESYFYVVL